jgi:ribosomal protein L11
MSNQYLSVKRDYEFLKNTNERIIDSLKNENVKTKKVIKTLEDALKNLDSKIENTTTIIEVVKKEEFVVSTSLSESASLLKKNLSCTEL